MGRPPPKFKISILCGFLVFLTGCANTPKESTTTPKIHVPSISSIKPEDYSSEIEKNHKIILSDLHSNIQQQAHLNLASLYSSPLNPNHNYELARKHLETYALFDPDFKNAVDPRTLLAALIEIEELSTQAAAQAIVMQELSQELEFLQKQAAATMGNQRHFSKENLRLNKTIGKLQNRVRSLEASNNRLHKTIEMLGTLDSQLEEKRSNFIKRDSTEEE